jgi:hypothetical protein
MDLKRNIYFDAGDQSQGVVHAKQVLHHDTIHPALKRNTLVYIRKKKIMCHRPQA